MHGLNTHVAELRCLPIIMLCTAACPPSGSFGSMAAYTAGPFRSCRPDPPKSPSTITAETELAQNLGVRVLSRLAKWLRSGSTALSNLGLEWRLRLIAPCRLASPDLPLLAMRSDGNT